MRAAGDQGTTATDGPTRVRVRGDLRLFGCGASSAYVGRGQCGMTKRPAMPMAKMTSARIESRPRRARHGSWRMITPNA